jgi:hypothetical protein
LNSKFILVENTDNAIDLLNEYAAEHLILACDDPEKTLPFLTGGFRLAAKHGYGVTPIAFHFHDPRDFWVGEVTFLGHAWQSFKRDAVHVTVCYGPTLYHSDPEILLNEAHQWIENKLKEKVKLNLVYV